jgi:tripartite-type tricarboxylate transporter receptor subunit TctC
VLSDARLRERAAQAGALVSPSSPEQLAERVARETAFWRETARVAGITAG